MSRVFSACKVFMAAAKTEAKAATRPSSGGLLKPVPVSPVMRKFVGVSEISRVDAVKKIWEHIKSNNLQDPLNRRQILCDEKLKTIFGGKDKVGMLEIAKLISPHFIKVS
ncbi:upstream activation factor subunit spp27-like [Aristolochia californica]|uniref:upstream activation factor subunit spp27-like n=1 Tax=Aristolochia californica TaxID=171875 RepID=UPI0035DF7C7E